MTQTTAISAPPRQHDLRVTFNNKAQVSTKTRNIDKVTADFGSAALDDPDGPDDYRTFFN
ncbi:MAG: hypothetical protein WBV78_03420 [Roseobacter sp.]